MNTMTQLNPVLRRETRKRFFMFSLVVIVISLVNIFLLLPQYIKELLPIPEFIAKTPIAKINNNYFLDVKILDNNKLLVNQSNCKIPDIYPWDPTIMHLMDLPEDREDCWKTHFHWTYTENMAIVMNESDIINSGYDPENIRCCYNIISREEQDANDYDMNADNQIKYSDDCVEMEKVTKPPTGEYFQVLCSTKSLAGKLRTLYTQYHTIPRIVGGILRNKKSKEEYWEKYLQNETHELPPNIIFVGIDSTSRLNVQRRMLKTVAALTEIGAIEMLGYTKVGANTFPNFAALFNGYSEDELYEICFKALHLKQDDCPFIWKRLEEANYFTAQIEDRPAYTGFNYMKTGFVHQPVDFYLRPLLIAAHENSPNLLNVLHIVKNDYLECIGYKSNDEIIVEYIKNIFEVTQRSKVPLFSLSWSTALTHDIGNNCELIDELYANLILSLNRNPDSNTIFIFLSDHGYRFGIYRETLSGWYEEKLPALWIYLPPRIKERFPNWEKSLKTNSRLLTSTFHLYWTINHILDEFTETKVMADEKNNKTGEVISRKFKYSLLNPVPDNWTCEDVGVPETYCACYPLQKVDSTDKNLLYAAENAIEHVNLFLPDDDCAVLSVNKIIGGALLDKTAHKTNKRITYVIAFTSKPGDFLFEADIDFYPDKNVFSKKANVLRTSKINTDVSCVNSPLWEQYCYCKFLLN